MGVARNVIKDAKLVPGGGASEMAVAAILKKKSMSIEGVEQVGIFVQSINGIGPVCYASVRIYRCFLNGVLVLLVLPTLVFSLEGASGVNNFE